MSREQILECAHAHFAAKGFSGASIRRIAQELSIHPASIYHHYSSKEAILDAVIANAFGSERALFDAVLAAGLEPDVCLYKLIYEDTLHVASKELSRQRLFLIPEIREGGFPAVTAATRRLVDVYQQQLDDGLEKGLFVAINARVVAEHLFSLGITVLLSDSPDQLGSPEEQALVAADFALRSLLVDTESLSRIRETARSLPIQASAYG